MATIRTAIDTGPGINDAGAVFYALSSPASNGLGPTTVAGNIGVTATTRNTGHLFAPMGRAGLPVIAGAAAALKPRSARPGSGERDTDEIGPDDQRDDPFPESKPKVAERKQPACEPKQAELILNADGPVSHDAPPLVVNIAAGMPARHALDHAAVAPATSLSLHEPCAMLLAERPGLLGSGPIGLAVDLAWGHEAGTPSHDRTTAPEPLAARLGGN